MSNPFDFNEDEASKCFEKSVIFGVSPSSTNFISAHDFMKQSMAAVSMFSEKDEGAINVANGYKPSSADFKQVQTVTPSLSESSQYSSSLNCDSLKVNTHASSVLKKVQEELNAAKKAIELLKQDRWVRLPVKETVQRMIQGKPYWLEGYRALSEKRKLLELAVKANDGNSILTVIIFMEKTLQQNLLYAEIQQTSSALNIYILYLRHSKAWKKLEDFYIFAKLIEEAAILRYEVLSLEGDVSKKVEGLSKWLIEYGSEIELADLNSYVNEEISLIKMQLKLEEEAKKLKSFNENTTSKSISYKRTVVMKPLMTTFSYCSLYYYDKNSEFYPETIRKTVEITNKQFEWAVLPPRVNLQKWTDVQNLLTSTSWMQRKESCYIGYENIVWMLHKANANEEETKKKSFNLFKNVNSFLDLKTGNSPH